MTFLQNLDLSFHLHANKDLVAESHLYLSYCLFLCLIQNTIMSIQKDQFNKEH